jgi:hypothetical protein
MAINPETWKQIGNYISRGWVALGPLVGVLVGAYITGKRQRRDWLADNKKEEYRELISAISKGLATYLQLYVGQSIRDTADQKQLMLATSHVLETSRSRLFITNQIRRLEVAKRWSASVVSYQKTTASSQAVSGG